MEIPMKNIRKAALSNLKRVFEWDDTKNTFYYHYLFFYILGTLIPEFMALSTTFFTIFHPIWIFFFSLQCSSMPSDIFLSMSIKRSMNLFFHPHYTSTFSYYSIFFLRIVIWAASLSDCTLSLLVFYLILPISWSRVSILCFLLIFVC